MTNPGLQGIKEKQTFVLNGARFSLMTSLAKSASPSRSRTREAPTVTIKDSTLHFAHAQSRRKAHARVASTTVRNSGFVPKPENGISIARSRCQYMVASKGTSAARALRGTFERGRRPSVIAALSA